VSIAAKENPYFFLPPRNALLFLYSAFSVAFIVLLQHFGRFLRTGTPPPESPSPTRRFPPFRWKRSFGTYPQRLSFSPLRLFYNGVSSHGRLGVECPILSLGIVKLCVCVSSPFHPNGPTHSYSLMRHAFSHPPPFYLRISIGTTLLVSFPSLSENFSSRRVIVPYSPCFARRILSGIIDRYRRTLLFGRFFLLSFIACRDGDFRSFCFDVRDYGHKPTSPRCLSPLLALSAPTL